MMEASEGSRLEPRRNPSSGGAPARAGGRKDEVEDGIDDGGQRGQQARAQKKPEQRAPPGRGFLAALICAWRCFAHQQLRCRKTPRESEWPPMLLSRWYGVNDDRHTPAAGRNPAPRCGIEARE